MKSIYNIERLLVYNTFLPLFLCCRYFFQMKQCNVAVPNYLSMFDVTVEQTAQEELMNSIAVSDSLPITNVKSVMLGHM